ncbi:hydroxyphenylacetyl-CoA thioesterase PaaI [Pararhodobacter sp.]|uniref:hydroxyphenylacetyl-CoA thioesterase PaaI n=1 Tax=Pararhodobacter sp. TaxID=2127056 RepID=UPI002FE1AEBF
MTPDELAQACAAAMWADDNATRHLGMELSDVRAGHATMTMRVRPEMTNGHKICHGGYIFTLADSAFAFACNTYNQRVVAQMGQITFLAPGQEGDVLTARAAEVWRQGRSGIYDITVTRQDGTRIAEFRGHSRSIKGTHLPEE